MVKLLTADLVSNKPSAHAPVIYRSTIILEAGRSRGQTPIPEIETVLSERPLTPSIPQRNPPTTIFRGIKGAFIEAVSRGSFMGSRLRRPRHHILRRLSAPLERLLTCPISTRFRSTGTSFPIFSSAWPFASVDQAFAPPTTSNKVSQGPLSALMFTVANFRGRCLQLE